jgi:disulfide bond formation protein DsbB
MGSTGVGLAAGAGAFVGLFTGIGLGAIILSRNGQRTRNEATIMLALSASGASLGAYFGGRMGAAHLLSQQNPFNQPAAQIAAATAPQSTTGATSGLASNTLNPSGVATS